MAEPLKKCVDCDGCGKVANTEDREPWTSWTRMPFIRGLVKPIPCETCKGSGKVASD